MLLTLYFALCSQKMGFIACLFSGLLLGAGFLLKQSAASAGLAIVLVFLLRRKYRQSVTLILTACVPVIMVLVLLLWRHEPFLENFFAAGRSTWSLLGALSWLREPHLLRPTAIMLFAVGAVGSLRAITEGEQAQMLVSFAVVNLIAGFATIPQLGGQTNYFLPGFAGCALLLPFAIRVFVENLDAVKLTGILVTLGFLAALADCAATFYFLPSSTGGRVIPSGYLSSLRVLSDDDYLLVRTRDPVLIDPFTAHSLELQGHWSSAASSEKLRWATTTWQFLVVAK
jgi:hypothetical protein